MNLIRLLFSLCVCFIASASDHCYSTDIIKPGDSLKKYQGYDFCTKPKYKAPENCLWYAIRKKIDGEIVYHYRLFCRGDRRLHRFWRYFDRDDDEDDYWDDDDDWDDYDDWDDWDDRDDWDDYDDRDDWDDDYLRRRSYGNTRYDDYVRWTRRGD
mgnify:FL=1